jgi:hypothetical protein
MVVWTCKAVRQDGGHARGVERSGDGMMAKEDTEEKYKLQRSAGGVEASREEQAEVSCGGGVEEWA